MPSVERLRMKSLSLRLAPVLFLLTVLGTERMARGQDVAAGMPSTVAEGAKLVSVYHDDRFFEGPAWDPKTRKLYFTAFAGKNAQILRLDEPGKLTVWLDKTEGVNGMYLANDGRVLGAQACGHRLLTYAIRHSRPTSTHIL